MWRDHGPPHPSHQRTRVPSTENAPHVMSHLPSPRTRLSPADLHLMESRMRGQRACPVWGEGGRKPHGAIPVWRLRPYSTDVYLESPSHPGPLGTVPSPTTSQQGGGDPTHATIREFLT